MKNPTGQPASPACATCGERPAEVGPRCRRCYNFWHPEAASLDAGAVEAHRLAVYVKDLRSKSRLAELGDPNARTRYDPGPGHEWWRHRLTDGDERDAGPCDCRCDACTTGGCCIG